MIHQETVHTIIVLAALTIIMASLLQLKQRLLKWGRGSCRVPE